eukprot:66997-Lingulodinium_polyedra.AAC.1
MPSFSDFPTPQALAGRALLQPGTWTPRGRHACCPAARRPLRALCWPSADVWPPCTSPGALSAWPVLPALPPLPARCAQRDHSAPQRWSK